MFKLPPLQTTLLLLLFLTEGELKHKISPYALLSLTIKKKHTRQKGKLNSMTNVTLGSSGKKPKRANGTRIGIHPEEKTARSALIGIKPEEVLQSRNTG